jgi:hypothetical protein
MLAICKVFVFTAALLKSTSSEILCYVIEAKVSDVSEDRSAFRDK